MQIVRTAIAAAAAVAAPAWAQSSVTLSGVADAAARVVRNEGAGSIKSLVSGSNATSRIVVRGSEDLGSGWSAGFWLEHGLLLDSGAPASTTQFWDRRATLHLVGKTAGEVRLGRDYVPTYTVWVRHDPFSHVGVAGSNNFASATPLGPIRNAFGANPNTTVRSSNSLQYLLPGNLAGVEGGLMVAAGEGGTAANGQHKVVAGRLGWQGGPFGIAAATTRTENNLTVVGGKFKDTVVGGNAAFGPVRLTAAWRRFEQGDAKQTNVIVAAVASFGAADVKASYLRANLAGRVGATAIGGNDARQIGLGTVYNLSKRSALYAQASRIDNDGAATFVVPGGPVVTAGGRTSTGFEAGMRHTF